MTKDLFIAKIIKANAGSGKTYALTKQYLELLFQGESVDHILATTFTKKAAGEILSRILVRLATAVVCKEEEIKLLNSLNLPDKKISTEKCFDNFIKLQHKILISTMDSFFAKIATSFSVELGLNSNLKISEESEKKKIYTEAIRKLCQEEESKELSSLISDFNDNDGKNSIDMALKEKLSSLYDIFISSSKNAWREFECDKEKLSEQNIKRIMEDLSFAEIPLTKNGTPNKNFEKAIDKLKDQIKLKEFDKCCDSGLCNAILTGENKYYSCEFSESLTKVLKNIIDIIEVELIGKLNKKTKSLYGLLSKYTMSYEELRNKKSIIGFSDLKNILKNVAVKDNLSEVYYRLDTRLRHILLDEFQDTSLVEWELIEPIIDEILAGGEKTFFCVGDPKQAIYGWRGGVAEIFDKITSKWLQIESETLTKSYRSSPVIIDFVNLICKNFSKTNLMHEYQDVASLWDENFPIHQAEKKIKGNVIIEGVLPQEKEEDDSLKKSITDLILEQTIRRVLELKEKNSSMSIGVLCRSNKFVNRVISCLKSEPYNLSVSQEGGVPLIDSKAIVFIVAVLKYMNHSDDSLAEYEIGLLSEEIIKNKKQFFDNLRNKFMYDGFFGVVSFLRNEIKNKISPNDDFKIEKLLDICMTYDKGIKNNIDDFIEDVRHAMIDSPSSSNIRVMTIHKAKGLEFDAVILPELNNEILNKTDILSVFYKDRVGRPSRIFANIPTIGKINKEIGHIEHQENSLKIREALCILYVALTRAKQHLSIFLPIKESSSTKTKKLNCADFITDILGDDFKNNNYIYESGDKDFFEEKIIKNEEKNNIIKKQFVSFNKKTEIKNLIVKSPSNAEGEGIYDIKNRFNLNIEKTLKKGSLYHKFYEQIDWLDDEKIENFDKNLFFNNEIAENFSDEELNKAYLKFLESLKYPKIKNKFLKSSYDKWDIDKIEILKEEQFIFRDNDSAFKGFIDRAVIGYKNNLVKNIEIIDFKSDFISDKNLIYEKALFYKPQIDIYTEALRRRFIKNDIKIYSTLLFVFMGEDYTYGNN